MNHKRIGEFVCRLGPDKTKKEVTNHLNNNGCGLIANNMVVAIDELVSGVITNRDFVLVLGCVLSQMKDVPIMYFLGK